MAKDNRLLAVDVGGDSLKMAEFSFGPDGGITLDNVSEILNAGANVIVSGSSVFKGNIAENVAGFLKIMG